MMSTLEVINSPNPLLATAVRKGSDSLRTWSFHEVSL